MQPAPHVTTGTAVDSADIASKISIAKYKSRVPNSLAYGVKPQPLSMRTSLAILGTPINSIPSKKDIVKRFGLN